LWSEFPNLGGKGESALWCREVLVITKNALEMAMEDGWLDFCGLFHALSDRDFRNLNLEWI
jgi:hypothetical protein